ncbi:hypothetical protein [Streptomyces sp. SAJ15]|uniref:hypothetical protein n=1 Tax=Streptomyces sp. SAJ15 TaxID=2011095 RepID=UPI00135EA70E|nr:hypothetical protein [Streptomyces sp. SAJ15]TVL91201.1 hypothetical protein CD790_18175 [Streptomyces sp. SAJ15]
MAKASIIACNGLRQNLIGAARIRAFDGAVDPVRAKGLLTALELLRADAARGAPLDFELLRGWQQHVLGAPQPPSFRTSPGTSTSASG